MNNTTGINEKGLDNLILKLHDTADQINLTLNAIEDLVEGTNEYFVCEMGDRFRNHFHEQKPNFQTICENIITYSNDLVKVKYKFQEKDMQDSKTIQENTVSTVNTINKKDIMGGIKDGNNN